MQPRAPGLLGAPALPSRGRPAPHGLQCRPPARRVECLPEAPAEGQSLVAGTRERGPFSVIVEGLTEALSLGVCQGF